MSDDYPYVAETDGVIVRVAPTFLEEESAPEAGRYVWAYRIMIENRANRSLQLLTRRWLITDCEGRTQEVEGVGVVGQTPLLRPGENFVYTSGAPLSAPSGMMQGSYQFEDDLGGVIDARIPAFALDSPYDTRAPN